MKKSIFALVAATIIALGAMPAMADGNGASAGASAGATASGGTTKNYGLANGGIGAALCADSFGTPIFSVSTSRRACEVMQGSMAMFDRKLLSPAEARAFGLKALEMSGAKFVNDNKDNKPATTSNATTKKAQGTYWAECVDHGTKGVWVKKLTSATRPQAVEECRADILDGRV